MTKKERLNKIFPILEKKFGKPKCALDFETPFQLMVAVILSAQCTDERVNIVTKELFKVVREPQDIRNMDIKMLEKYIKSTGFYKNKAKNIKLNAEVLFRKAADDPENVLDELRVQGRRRLVEQHDLRFYRHRTGAGKRFGRRPRQPAPSIGRFAPVAL